MVTLGRGFLGSRVPLRKAHPMDDARRLAALGGQLRVKRASSGAATVVEIRLPERLGGDWLEPTRPGLAEYPAPDPSAPDPSAPDPSAPEPAAPDSSAPEPAGSPPGEAEAAEPESPAGAAARRLLTLLVADREAPVDTPPLRVAADRQDGLARVAVVGAAAAELVPVLAGPAGAAGWDPPAGVVAPICYQYRPYPRITLDPARGVPPWRPVRLPGWSGVAWPHAAAGVDRILVEGPMEALRGLRLLHYRDRADADLAARLCQWSGTADGPPDAVVLALCGPASAAESEFLTVLRAPGGDGFSPVVICAPRTDTGAAVGAQQRLQSMCDALVEWRAIPRGGTAVDAALRTRVCAWAAVLPARWALRALVASLAVGRLDDQFARAVEGAVAGAHQVAELDLLQALQGGRIRVPRGHDEALRLLGVYGTDARSRLGLAADAGSGQVTEAAGRALVFWRTQSMAPDAGPAGRSACALLVRACERLFASGAA